MKTRAAVAFALKVTVKLAPTPPETVPKAVAPWLTAPLAKTI